MTERKPSIEPERARELLAVERQRIESSLAEFERGKRGDQAEIETATDPVDDAEVITETEVDDAVQRQLRDELAAVERAEQRLEDGTYGFSIESGEPISAGRLEAVPWAERTPEEQERQEGGPP